MVTTMNGVSNKIKYKGLLEVYGTIPFSTILLPRRRIRCRYNKTTSRVDEI